MRKKTNPLLDLVDKLTISHVITTALDDGIKHRESHDGLIKQLRSAVASNIGGSASGKQLFERIPLDVDALSKYELIEKIISEKYVKTLDKVPGLYPENNLREWYIVFYNHPRTTEKEYDFEVKLLKSWVKLIEDKLSPPTVLELAKSECPECSCDWYFDVVNKTPLEVERKAALTVTYRPDDKGGLTESFAQCRCCSFNWEGSTGVRALAYELEKQSSKHTQHAQLIE